MKISFSTFYNPYQYKKIDPGKSDIIYYFEIPKGYIGFIDQLANNYFPNTYIEFWVDNFVNIIQRQIAPLNEPKKYEPPIVAFNVIKWIGYNNDTSSHIFEVLCDGYLVKVK